MRSVEEEQRGAAQSKASNESLVLLRLGNGMRLTFQSLKELTVPLELSLRVLIQVVGE